ncbi:11051_t:CDS:2 [Funneliformis geosporum]|uniref:11051_t:CDS:1 n=1 Tax=Funneliformis geosporum TaxID=1117311 RepID=A0A9W4SJI7_9GLOM|nr:11051_t:CDS:2 [Funneliformis geosporum]
MISELFTGLSKDFSRLLKDADDYNVIIEIGEGPNIKKFRAHSVILRARSLYFHSALSSEYSRKENGCIIFKQPGVSPSIFDMIINYCNKLITEDARILFEAKDFNSVDEDVLVSVLQRDDLGLQEIEIWNKVIQWGKANTSKLKENVSNWKKEDFMYLERTMHRIIPLLRLFQMSPADYCHNVRPYKQILPKNLQEDLLCYYLANDQPKSTIILPPRVSPIKIDSTIIGPQHTALIARWLDNEPIEIDDLVWLGPKFGKGPDLWVRMNTDKSGEARKDTYESNVLEVEGRFRWIECEIFSIMKK